MAASTNPPSDYADIAFNLLFAAAAIWTTWNLWTFFKPRQQHSLRSVAILVLGDIGRSPRMMYHAQSFAENEFVTDIIGYGGSKPIPALERLPRVQLRYLPEPPRILRSLPFVIVAPLKITHQIVTIFFELLIRIPQPPEFILVQNPPSIPTLALVWLVSRIRGSKVIIDWHNLGYSILALRLGEDHTYVKIAKRFERTFGRSAYAHLFVTQAMHDFLVKEWDLQGQKFVLHDRPPEHFHRCSDQETHELFRHLEPLLAAKKSLKDFLPPSSAPYSTALTQTTAPTSTASGNPSRQARSSKIAAPENQINPEMLFAQVRAPALRPDRPALVVSSTSWTPDEDFRILLGALQIYEARARELSGSKETHGKLPRMLVIVTGKGPLRDEYMGKIEKLQEKWEWVRCVSLWLEAENYPLLLGSADLGVSLHSSSSALDLPMKIVDMFGCGLPVCALDFKCLGELVKDGVNGRVFKDATGLASLFEDLLHDFPKADNLRPLRSSLLRSSPSRRNPRSPNRNSRSEVGWGSWGENWGRVMRPLILRDANR